MKLVRSIDGTIQHGPTKSINLDNVRWLKMLVKHLMTSVFGLWQRVVDSGHAKHIIHMRPTNMRVRSAKELLKEFKAVSFNQVDAIELEEYLRTGAKWDKQQKVWHLFTELST